MSYKMLLIGALALMLLLVAGLLTSVPLSSQAQAGHSFISPLSSPLATPSPASTSTSPYGWTQQALNYVTARYNIPPDKLLIVNEHERAYPLTGRRFQAFTVLDTRTPQSPSYSFLIDIATGVIEEDVAAIRTAEDVASSKKYGKFQPALYDRLQQVSNTAVLPIAVWLAPQANQHTFPQVYAELTARFPEAAHALAKGGKPFDVNNPALAEKIREAYDQLQDENVSARTQPVIDYLKGKGFAVTSYSGMPSVATRLPKWAILALANRDDVSMIYLTEEQGANTMDTAASTDRVPAVWQRGINGNGQKVAVIENNNISSNCLNVVARRTAVPYPDPNTDLTHSSRVANVVACNADPYRGVAYGAQIIDAGYDATDWPGPSSEQDAVAALTWAIVSPQNARTVNVSQGWETDNEINWMDRAFDYYARERNVTLVVAAGNSGGSLSSPAKAWNIISVGGSDDQGTADWSDLMYANSSYIDPTSGPNGHGDREKPEVVAPAVSISALGPDGTPAPKNGTSYAAPQVSGLAALLMNRNSALTVWPEAVKAIIMASAIHNIDGPKDIPSYQDLKDGAGAIVADLADTIANVRQSSGAVCNEPCWWGVGTSDSNPLVGGSIYQYFTASQGERVRVAIAWFASADAPATPPALARDELLTNYQLYVYKPSGGDPIGYTASWDNNYELVDFFATETGQYQIRIYRQPDGDYQEQSNSIGIAWVKLDPFRIFLSGVMNNFTTELIKNGNFDSGTTYWDTSRNSSCNYPIVTNFLTTTNPAAGLGVCNNNRDSISQTVTIPTGVTSAYLSYRYYLRRPLAAAHPINCNEQNPPLQGDCFYIEIVDEVSGQTYPLTTQNDNEPGEVWNYRQHSLLNIPNITGHPIKVSFRVRNDQNYPATFWLDDVSLQITY
jgi:hypothetical protein